jgi:outer membrane protein assembly factor BamB
MRAIMWTICLFVALGEAHCLAADAKPSADWPQWRGPNRDGVVHGVTAPEKWPRVLKRQWKVTVGEGAASPVVVAGKVYVFTRQKDNEVVRCLDLGSGKTVWQSEPYPAPYRPGPGDGFTIGPRSTPVVADNRVFTLGISGVLSCLDARTGKQLWLKDCQPYPPYSGASPLVANGLCIVHYGDGKKGGLTALDTQTGDVKWCYTDGSSPMSASPILVSLAGERQVVTCTSWNFLGVSLATGKKLWGLQASFGLGTRCVTPLVYRDLLVVADYMEPLRAVRLEKGKTGLMAKVVWKANGMPLYMSTPVHASDLLFGMSPRKRGCFFCLEAKSGKTLWESDSKQVVGNAAILNAGSVVLFLTSSGQLVVVKPTGKAYEPIARYRVSDTQTWAHPVFLGDRLLIKDHTTLTSFRIEPDSPGK